jgi:zinc/manganese transport system permease protein
VTYLLERTRLWTDALLNIIYSSSLAIAIIVLSFVGQYKGGLNNLLFGDILAVQELDLVLSGLLLIVCTVFIGLTLRTQMLLTLHEPLAIARGISVSAQRTAFIVLLSLVVGISIKAIGVLLLLAISSGVSLALLMVDGAQAASGLSQAAESSVSFSGKPVFRLNLVNSTLNWTEQPDSPNPILHSLGCVCAVCSQPNREITL